MTKHRIQSGTAFFISLLRQGAHGRRVGPQDHRRHDAPVAARLDPAVGKRRDPVPARQLAPTMGDLKCDADVVRAGTESYQ